MTTPIYAVGDIHGQRAMLDRALDLINADGGPDARIVFIGDYVDRGPDSAEVVGFLIDQLQAERPWTCLKGNHDRMFEWFLRDPMLFDPHLFADLTWLHDRLGGLETLASYGVDVAGRRRLGDLHAEARAAVPAAHIRFLQERELFHDTDDIFFVHAGIRPGLPLTDQGETDLLWIRDGFLEHTAPHPKLIVHGHTALPHPQHFGNRIDLDGGAGYGRPLHPAVFEGTECWLLTDKGRVPMRS